MRLPPGVLGLAAALVAVIASAPAEAQVTLCESQGFAAVAGGPACSGAATPVTVTATVRTSATLALEEVFGRAAAGLQAALGDVDASCASSVAAGLACASDAGGGAATWYGDIRFRVRLAGLGAATARITAFRPSAGPIPAGRLLDGPPGGVPATVYPVAPAPAADLETAIGGGDTLVTRSLGLRVLPTDPRGAWTADTVFSLVVE